MKRDMSDKLLSIIEVKKDIIVLFVQIILKSWVALKMSVLPCLKNGIMKRTQKPPKIVLLDPIRKCGGSAVPAAMSGRQPPTVDFVEVGALSAVNSATTY